MHGSDHVRLCVCKLLMVGEMNKLGHVYVVNAEVVFTRF